MLLCHLAVAGALWAQFAVASKAFENVDGETLAVELKNADLESFAALTEFKAKVTNPTFSPESAIAPSSWLTETVQAFDTFSTSYVSRYLEYFRAALLVSLRKTGVLGAHTRQLECYEFMRDGFIDFLAVYATTPYIQHLASFLEQLQIGSKHFEFCGCDKLDESAEVLRTNLAILYYELVGKTVSLFACLARGISAVRSIAKDDELANKVALEPESRKWVYEILEGAEPAAAEFVNALNAFSCKVRDSAANNFQHVFPLTNVPLDISPLSLLSEFRELTTGFYARFGGNSDQVTRCIEVLEGVDPIYHAKISDGLFQLLSVHFQGDEELSKMVRIIEARDWNREVAVRQALLNGLSNGTIKPNSRRISGLVKRDSIEYAAYLAGLLDSEGQRAVYLAGEIIKAAKIAVPLLRATAKYQVSPYPSLPRLRALTLLERIERLFFFEEDFEELVNRMGDLCSQEASRLVVQFFQASNFYDSVSELSSHLSQVGVVMYVCHGASLKFVPTKQLSPEFIEAVRARVVSERVFG